MVCSLEGDHIVCKGMAELWGYRQPEGNRKHDSTYLARRAEGLIGSKWTGGMADSEMMMSEIDNYNAAIDKNGDHYIDDAEVWNYFIQHIHLYPAKSVVAIVAQVAKEAEAGDIKSIIVLGKLASVVDPKVMAKYKPILVKLAASDPKYRDGEITVMAAKQSLAQLRAAKECADLKAKIRQYAPVEIILSDEGLTPNQIQVRNLIIVSGKVIDEMFWDQISPDGRALRDRLYDTNTVLAKRQLHFLQLNYGRFDQYAHPKKAFIGKGELPEGSNFYPLDMTKATFEAYVQAHPEQKDELMKPNTLIRRDGDRLIAIPFETAYHPYLEKAAAFLQQAAAIAEDAPLKAYLSQKAIDLLSGDYTESDRLWLALDKSAIDVVIGYEETYDDKVSGAKASYEVYVMQKDAAASAELDGYKKLMPDFQTRLPVDASLKSKVPIPGPIGVFDLVYAGGDANQSTKTLATNLPNTESVRAKYGNRLVLFSNVHKAKAQKILFPIARRIIDPSQMKYMGEKEFAAHSIQHEVSHSLGLDYVVDRTTGKATETTIRSALKEQYGGIEECKADTLALYNLRWQGVDAEKEMKFYVTNLASIFRSIRFGIEDAHGVANVIRLNFLIAEGAISYDDKTGTWKVVSLEAMRAGLEKLTKALLEIEGYGDYNNAVKLGADFGQPTAAITSTLAKLTDIPIDLEFIQR